MSKDPTPMFSVVVPTYNRAHILPDLIRSVDSQEYRNFELIIVDDGSTDSTPSIVRSFGHPYLRYLRQPNAGGGAARNAGIFTAKGRYIALLDSDDLFLPNKLGAVYEALSREGSEVVLYSRAIVNRGVGRTWIKPERAIGTGERVDEYLFCANQVIPTPTLVVPTALAKRVLFDPQLRIGQDLDFCVRLAGQGATFRMIERPLIVWNDFAEVGRTSYENGYAEAAEFLAKNAQRLSNRAVIGYRATVLAYHRAAFDRLGAIYEIATGVVRGGVPIRVAARQLLRCVLPRRIYRRAVNTFVAIFGVASTGA